MSAEEREFGLGIVGCGGFGLFAIEQFVKIPGVKLVGIAETFPDAAIVACNRFGLPDVQEIGALLKMPGVDIVYIATPPFLHFSQAMEALQAGKHVLIEKPTALNLMEAEELLAVARERGLFLATDLMQRYNPLYDAIDGLLTRKPLGELLHAYFENYACDEQLPADHWFWDRTKSGGIFIEHGVHFFDLFAGWLGPGKVEAAQMCMRPGTRIEDQVQCTVRYGEVLVNFYHGFTQLGRMDRQELRLVFERGDVRLDEWIPIRATIHAVVADADMSTLSDLFPGARFDVTATYSERERICSGRHKALNISQRIEMSYGQGVEKMQRYGEMVRDLLADQIAWIVDRQHVRRITNQNGIDSLAMAIVADALAHAGNVHH
jgi:predicted dehydrogenase